MSDIKNFQFNKKFGQNFIFDKNLLTAIVNDSGIDKNTNVLEIGAGAGTLTRILAENAKRVKSYEIDTRLTEILSGLNYDNLDIEFKDILKVKVEDIENYFNNEKYKIVANLPYYITTPIIFKFIEESKNLDSLVIMVQQEVAERICAKPNNDNYGAITPSIDFRADARILRKVKRTMFTPPPQVDSAIVEIKMNKQKYIVKDDKILENIIKCAFSMRRKTLMNNLKNYGLNQEQIVGLFDKLGFDYNIRGEKLTTKEFVDLANLIFEI